MSVAAETGRGIAWSGASKAISQLVGVLVSLALARLLTPKEFGLVAMVVVFTGFLHLTSDLGLSAALVQRTAIREEHRSTVFWCLVFTGLGLGALCFVLAPYVAAFYRAPELTPLVRVLALDLVLAPWVKTHYALLSREMRFRSIAIAESASVIVSSAAALTLAWLGHGVWALVGKSLIGTLVFAIALWRISSWRPALMWNWSALFGLMRYGRNLLGHDIVNFWAQQADDLLVGRRMGAAPLGLYTRAYNTMLLPVGEVGAVIGRVMFPALARLQNDDAEARRLYLRVVSATALLTFPVLAGLFVLADSFLLVAFGEHWTSAATVLRIYAVIGAYMAISNTVSWIYKSRGRTDWMLRWTLASSVVTVGAVVIGASYGTIEAVALSYGVATVLVLSYPHFKIGGSLIGVTPGQVFGSVSGAALAASLMAGALWGARQVLPDGTSAGVELVLCGLLGSILYLVLLRVLRVQSYLTLRQELRARLEAWTGVEKRPSQPPGP